MGDETTIRDVSKKMSGSKGLSRLVKNITQDCVKWKIKMKKVSELKMSTHSEASTPLSCFNGGYSVWFQGKTIQRSKFTQVYASLRKFTQVYTS